MQKYIGTDIINAEPMTRQICYKDMFGRNVPEGEDGAEEGYVTVSWLSKKKFDKTYTLLRIDVLVDDSPIME